MNKLNSTNWDGCPIRFGAGIFGDKWVLIILRDIIFKNKQYYGDFHKSEEGISTNILADRLVKLEKNGVLRKESDPHNQSKFIYSLTEKGLDLIPVMTAIIIWAEKHDPCTLVSKTQIKAFNKTDSVDNLRKRIQRS